MLRQFTASLMCVATLMIALATPRQGMAQGTCPNGVTQEQLNQVRALLAGESPAVIEAKVVGDMIMGLAETCRAAGKNISEYLLTAHRNKKQVHKNPEAWYPGSPAIFFHG